MKGEWNEKEDNKKYIEQLREYVRLLAMKAEADEKMASEILEILLKTDPERGISDEEIEGITGYRQSDVRKVLRVLYNAKLSTYKRGKHPESEATRYYWYIDMKSVSLAIVKRKKSVLEKLKSRLEYEKSHEFYKCPKDNTRYTFDDAFEYDFTCPKCGSLLEPDDNSSYIKVLEERIARLEEEIKSDEKKVFGS
ncbi:MAG: transcription initiation factor IIE subunit alpha [Caldisphaeraceae archaeon]|nr:transcription initiation factor IIE subunit alpha [Caldisphaeraceae archaeon]MEB2793682.1 transcription initiation factor IIE subunit alpha [Caldisphaeraceae archaeon]MEB3691823.1 transcription initiation factor IIE subunit alpha [Caldisphaeraceae archaeon]MEB3797763.1 transcription initiation factor IIE subunit alpha [Caldisphaeraceae archaeon]